MVSCEQLYVFMVGEAVDALFYHDIDSDLLQFTCVTERHSD